MIGYQGSDVPHLLLLLSMSWVAVFFCTILYQVPKRATLWVGLIGTVAWFTQDVSVRLGLTAVGAAFLGGLVVSALSEMFARKMRMPVIVFVVGGIVPLVPGSSAFRTMREFVTGHQLQGLAQGTNTFLIASAISAGLVIAGTIMRLDRRKRYENPSGDQASTPDGL